MDNLLSQLMMRMPLRSAGVESTSEVDPEEEERKKNPLSYLLKKYKGETSKMDVKKPNQHEQKVLDYKKPSENGIMSSLHAFSKTKDPNTTFGGFMAPRPPEEGIVPSQKADMKTPTHRMAETAGPSTFDRNKEVLKRREEGLDWDQLLFEGPMGDLNDAMTKVRQSGRNWVYENIDLPLSRIMPEVKERLSGGIMRDIEKKTGKKVIKNAIFNFNGMAKIIKSTFKAVGAWDVMEAAGKESPVLFGGAIKEPENSGLRMLWGIGAGMEGLSKLFPTVTQDILESEDVERATFETGVEFAKFAPDMVKDFVHATFMPGTPTGSEALKRIEEDLVGHTLGLMLGIKGLSPTMKASNAVMEAAESLTQPIVKKVQTKLASEKGAVELPGETKPAGKSSSVTHNELMDYLDNITVNPFGDVKKRIRKEYEMNRELASEQVLLERYGLKDRPKKLPNDVVDRLALDEYKTMGVAPMTTKTGKEVPGVRKSGTFVDQAFVDGLNEYGVDIGSFMERVLNPVRAIQKMDGSQKLSQRTKLPDQMGVVEKNILVRTHDLEQIKWKWQNEQTARVKKAEENAGGLSKDSRYKSYDMLEHINSKEAYIAPEKLLEKKGIGKITEKMEPAEAAKLVEFTQESRKFFDSWIHQDNLIRDKFDLPLISKKKNYSSDNYKEMTLKERLFGEGKNAFEMFQEDVPSAPDFIQPNKPYHRPEHPQTGGLKQEGKTAGHIKKFLKDKDIIHVMEQYIATTARDMSHTAIIQNAKIHAQAMRDAGFRNNAAFIQEWISESYAGVSRTTFGGINFSKNKTLAKCARWSRIALNRTVFPANLTWITTVQPLSAAFTIGRFGVKNSALAIKDWLFDKSKRDWVKSTYISQKKRRGSAKITQQDIGGSSEAINLKKSLGERASNVLNMALEQTEYNLTGWSIAAARRYGEAKGIKNEKALKEYASQGGSETQTDYSRGGVPSFIRDELVNTVARFQSFPFQGFNNFLEWAGKAGIPPETARARLGYAARFIGTVTAMNYITEMATGRKAWGVSSFFPFWGFIVQPIIDKATGRRGQVNTRQLATPISLASEAASVGWEWGKSVGKYSWDEFTTDKDVAFRDYIETGQTARLRKWMLKYGTAIAGFPAGTQINNTVDGILAIAEDDPYITNVAEGARAVVGGRHRTKAGIDSREKYKKGQLEVFKPSVKTKASDYVRDLPADLLMATPGIGEVIGRKKLSKKAMKFYRGLLEAGETEEAEAYLQRQTNR